MGQWPLSSDNELRHSGVVEGEIRRQLEESAKLQPPLELDNGLHVQHHTAAVLEEMFLPDGCCAPGYCGGPLLVKL